MEIVDAMAVTLARSNVDLADERATAIFLLEAGYDEREIANHRLQAARAARSRRKADDICAGRPAKGGARG
ncbi:hypothetical protein J2X65_003195 [Ancylobacter sp. 3268]|uniref:hypothetical protein n=1 Tax=Ancylobacter sp. 3268 TaxID=2817752 RepID=UPI002856F16D|nr:hypothetical protein [Ancylobacter sp. 3268]MDR6953832.1 hypothetical protein [Ancylobacter sp. 3268]